MSDSRTLRVLARLMAYPEQALLDSVPAMLAVVRTEGWLAPPLSERLEQFMLGIAARSAFDVQEQYVSLFDRGRALSLHLFEHVHGESRDRGQAMVDLLELYRDGGLELDARELPDYLPLMLEYLSTRERDEVVDLLADAMGVIVLLGARLRERHSEYAVLFEALEAIAGSPADAEIIKRKAATEGPDQTIEKMDEIWAEEQVTFMGNSDPAGGCGTSRLQQQDPIAAAGIAVRIENGTPKPHAVSGNRR
ncbi:MAG TPA: nitrate reductase molybdenum cofactor assembly chaperone [Woeseiaceae bacterium]|nr:nitrate reductase molybdenum cofactor assembly chaperone [Woeseiaceae bacterium]